MLMLYYLKGDFFWDLFLTLVYDTEPFYLPVIDDDELELIAMNGVKAPYTADELRRIIRNPHDGPVSRPVSVYYYPVADEGWSLTAQHEHRPGQMIAVERCGFSPEEVAERVNESLKALRDRAESTPNPAHSGPYGVSAWLPENTNARFF